MIVALSFWPKTALVEAFNKTLNFSLPSSILSLMMSAAQVTPDMPKKKLKELCKRVIITVGESQFHKEE